MDRRLFLTGMLGLTGATLLAGAVTPRAALAGIPNAGTPDTGENGILDELKQPVDKLALDEGTDAVVEPVQYWRGRRRRRRPVWRRVCRRYWARGRWRVRCYRRRYWW